MKIRFLPLLWPLLAASILALATAVICMELLSSLRAYVGGEGLWSKAQQDAVRHLREYARTRSSSELQQFHQHLLVPQGDRVAREALQMSPANRNLASTGFLAGGNHPQDIDGMIWLFLLGSELPEMKRAIDVWTRADGEIARLDAFAGTLQAHSSSREDLDETIRRIDHIDEGLRSLEVEFSASLGLASRHTTRFVLWFASVASIVFMGLGIARARANFLRAGSIERALRESEQRFRFLASNVRDYAIVMMDGQGIVMSWNAGARQVHGYDSADIVGQSHECFFLPEEVAAGKPAELLRRTDSEGRASDIGWRLRKDGSRFMAEVVVMPVRDDEGARVGFATILRDISEQRRVEQMLRQEKLQAEEANGAKSRFLATMSHEIRTPLNGILGMAELLQGTNLSEAERQEYLRIVIGSGQTLLALLNDILDLSRVESGRIEFEQIPFRPEELVRDVATLYRELAQAKGLEIRISMAELRGGVRISDPVRLRQMLSNLVSNAIKFTSRGSIHIECREREVPAGSSQLEFSVRDTGIGIPASRQGTLFQPFAQVDASTTRRFGGSGLGLSIVRMLSLRMGGDCGLESEEGEGTRVWFSVPASPGPVPQAGGGPEPASQPQAAPTAPWSGAPWVLVAEDNPTNIRVIEGMLRRLGIRFETVTDGQAALARLADGPAPALVLMDCQMPVMDGWEATVQFRALERERGTLRVPILALTAGAFENDRERCLACGMDDFLPKPISLAILRGAMEKWLASSLVQ